MFALVLTANVLSGVLCCVYFINSKFSFPVYVVRDARSVMKYNEMRKNEVFEKKTGNVRINVTLRRVLATAL